VRPRTSALASLLCASLLMPTAAGFAQDLGRGRGRLIESGPVDVERLVQRAGLIVHGVVASKQPRWIGRVIYTQYELVVQETLKGDVRNSVLVSVAGGALGNVQLKVPGAPDLQIGDPLIFFGGPLEGGPSFTPVGTFDGIVPIRPGRGDAAATVSPRGTPETLTAFLQEVRALSSRR
jgi:hypothetical protein